MARELYSGLIAGSLVVIILVSVLLLVRWLLWRRFFMRESDGGQVFTVAQLQRMFDRGLISRQEFETIRGRLLSQMGLVEKRSAFSVESNEADTETLSNPGGEDYMVE